MLKNHDLMYCFEIDGTLVNNIPYNFKNPFTRNFKILNSKCLFNPNEYDIRWTIVTNHPFMDYVSIRWFCFRHSMIPSQIITSNVFGLYNKTEKRAEYKTNLFKNILDGKFNVKYTKNKVNKIINVCNDQTENKLINSNRNGYEFISVNVIDFKREFFNRII